MWLATTDDGVSNLTIIFMFLGNPRIYMSLSKLLGYKLNRVELIVLHMHGVPDSPAHT